MDWTFIAVWLILCFLNALMDAIDHGRSMMRLGHLWHGTKWVLVGLLLWYVGSLIGYMVLILPIAVGFFLWEGSYYLLRKIDWRKHPWA